MTKQLLKPNALVLYKNYPARIVKIGPKKIEIDAQGRGKVSVRAKDVQLLHDGPLKSLADLRPPAGDVETAWELLAGETAVFSELADLIYDADTPATTWALWRLVEDGLYFGRRGDEIYAHTEAEVAAIQAARGAKAAKKQAWDDFITRAGRGEYAKEDGRYLQEIAAVALKQRAKSAALKALKQAETPENAHALLLRLGYWDETFNPYPARAGVADRSSRAPLGEMRTEERRDFTHLAAYAIDDAGSKDPDDALSWDDGRIWVHISDVAALVPPDSPADLEARARGANLYLPEGTVNMLPSEATALLGLGLSEISPALSFGMNITPKGEVENLEIRPSLVRVTRLSYAEAEKRLDEPVFKELYAAAQLYEDRRRENGSIQIDLPEVRTRVTDGKVSIRPLPKLRSRDLVREAMLMTGEAVARFAFTWSIPLPYTAQEPPIEPLEPASPIPTAPTTAQFFARRRKMQPSRPAGAPGFHAGLGMGMYVQATSPLRRYLDLVVHQQLRAWLRGDEPLDAGELMTRVGAAGAITGDVRYAERQSNKHWALVYLMQNPGWRGEGIVVDQRGKKDLVLLPALGLETQIYRRGKRPLVNGSTLDSLLQLKINSVDLPNLDSRFELPVTSKVTGT